MELLNLTSENSTRRTMVVWGPRTGLGFHGVISEGLDVPNNALDMWIDDEVTPEFAAADRGALTAMNRNRTNANCDEVSVCLKWRTLCML